MSDFRDVYSLLNELSNVHENSEIEFKESADKLPKAFWETYSAFANTAGGYVLLGVSESKGNEIIGVNNSEKIKQELFALANNKEKVSHNVLSNSDVTEYEIEGRIVVSVYVKELPSRQKPLYLTGNPLHAYIRKNESDCRITIEDYRRFVRNSEDNVDGELLNEYTLDDLNADSIMAFKRIMNEREPDKEFMKMDDIAFLKSVGVFRIDRLDKRKLKLTFAGLLFLGKLDAITQKIPHFHLDYINRRGSSIERWRDRVSTGDSNYPDLNLFEFYRIVREKLRLTVEDKFELDEKSVRKPPSELHKALREALANMIIHADYLDAETTLKVTVDNVYYTFLNPGMMRISRVQFFTGGHSEPRNNTLILYFRRMGESERAGTGGKEIIDVVSRNKYRMPELNTDLKRTELKLWSAAPAYAYEDLSENAKIILKLICDKIKVTRADIAKNTGLSRHYTYNALDELVTKGLIKRTGDGRATVYHWAPSIIETVDFANKLADTIRNIPSLKKGREP